MQDPDLWRRIENYEFPNGFDTKLLHAGIGWGQSRAREEYRRFVYLMVISDAPLTPSGIVDAVWHVHLSYTRNYWQVFCAEVLKQDLHHDPSDVQEAYAINDKQYLQTLALYEEEFGKRPPLKIWPTKTLWRRVLAGSIVAIIGALLGLQLIAADQIVSSSLAPIAIALIVAGGGYALYNLPAGRPSTAGGSGCGGGTAG